MNDVLFKKICCNKMDVLRLKRVAEDIHGVYIPRVDNDCKELREKVGEIIDRCAEEIRNVCQYQLEKI